MFICALDAALILSAELNHMIELITLKALHDSTVFFELFAFALVIYI